MKKRGPMPGLRNALSFLKCGLINPGARTRACVSRPLCVHGCTQVLSL